MNQTTAQLIATLRNPSVAAESEAVDRDQDWEREATIFTFADGSKLRVSGTDAEAIVNIDTLTPNEAWETYVGSQGVREFVDYSASPDVVTCVNDYVSGSELCADLTADERATVARLLGVHIARNL